MKVLAVCAHPDDEVLGCGGTIARHVREGDEVHVHFMTRGREGSDGPKMAWKAKEVLGYHLVEASDAPWLETNFAGFPDNAMDVISLLKIAQQVEAWVDEVNPDIVYTHHRGDLNIDHQLTHRAVMTAFRPWIRRANIYSFEVPSATECGLSPFVPNHYTMLTEQDMDKFTDACKAYSGELTDVREGRFLVDRRAIRGSEIRAAWAEAFQVEKQIW